MTEIRRKALRGLNPPGSHAGIALAYMLNTHEKPGPKEPHPYTTLLQKIAGLEFSPAYPAAFGRWRAAMEQQGALFIEATTTGPLAIGLGNASPIENGLSLHHTYGTPYLPGSALKGLMIRAADRYGLGDKDKEVLFGTTDSASHLVCWDGWLDPSSKQPFQKDVITVHHQNYYGSGKEWPTDFDDPNPVAFLSVKPGTKFCIALSSASSNSDGWVFAAAEIMKWGLENMGLGGKTNAGYGYFKVKLPEKPKSETELGEELYQSYRARIERVKPNNERGELEFFLRELSGRPPSVRRATLEAIKKQLVDWKIWKATNPQHAEIDRLLGG